MYTYKGFCSCGTVNIKLELPSDIKSYSPRKCDCNFCMENNLLYLSDPKGNVEIDSSKPFKILKQGSEQADFLACQDCNSIVGPIYHFSVGIKGAINANLLENKSELKEPNVISPKLLTSKEKIERWKYLWLKVELKGDI